MGVFLGYMTSTSNQIVRVGVVLFVLAGVGLSGYQIGYRNGAGGVSPQAQNGRLPAVSESRMILGTVDKISGQEITLKDVRRISDTSPGAVGKSVTVTVVSSTIIERLVLKDAATLKKEQDAFSKELQAKGANDPTNSMVPPEPFTRTKIAFSDIKAGNFLVVSSDQDLSKLSAFTATRIDVQEKSPSSPVSPSAVVSTTTKATGAAVLPPPPIPADAHTAR